MNDGRPDRQLVALLLESWRTELEGAATYRWLATQSDDPLQAHLLSELAAAEERHAARLAERLRTLGAEIPPPPTVQIPLGLRLRARAGIEGALVEIEAREDAHLERYEAVAQRLGDPELAALLHELARDEAHHARTLRGLSGPVGAHEPRGRLEAILRGERHVSTGSWIGDAVYGANDGLGAVFGLVAGVAGAAVSSHFILLAGIAGAIASAVSMGSGAFLAARSEREVYEAERAREWLEIREDPAEEKEELLLFYQLKGFAEPEARAIVERLASDPERFLEAMVQEELGLSAERLPTPLTSAFSAILSTALGASIPVLPFVFLTGPAAILTAFGVSLLGHFAVGAAKSLFTIRPWWRSGLEMTGIGILVGAVTYAVGYLFGVG